MENWKNQSQRNRNQYSDIPHPCLRTDAKDQDDRDLADLNARVTNADADHQDMMTDPSQNLHTKIDFSGDIVVMMNDLKDKHPSFLTPDKDTVRRGVLSQVL